MKAKWFETSVITAKIEDSIKTDIRTGAFCSSEGIDVGIIWNEMCHGKKQRVCQIGIGGLTSTQALELAEALKKAAEYLEEKSDK